MLCTRLKWRWIIFHFNNDIVTDGYLLVYNIIIIASCLVENIMVYSFSSTRNKNNIISMALHKVLNCFALHILTYSTHISIIIILYHIYFRTLIIKFQTRQNFFLTVMTLSSRVITGYYSCSLRNLQQRRRSVHWPPTRIMDEIVVF